MLRRILCSVIVLSACLLAIANASDLAMAGPLALPPRPTPVPTAAPKVPVSPIKGGLIRLSVDTSLTTVWTSIEWQDVEGQWQAVEGWQGTLDSDLTKTWWVAEADWGKGPFRWVLRDRREGEIVGHSQTFYLPTNNRQTVDIQLAVSR